MGASTRFYMPKNNDPTTKTAVVSPCLINQGEAVLLGIFGGTGPTSGAIQNTTIFSLTIQEQRG
jgi:hypothetical protein